MSTTTATAPGSGAEIRESWVPMIAIALGQAIMSFNVAALPVSLSGMVGELRRAADHGRHRHRHVLARGRWPRDAGCQAPAALRRHPGVPRRRSASSRWRQVLMTLQPVGDRDDRRPGPRRHLAAAVIVPALVALIANHYQGTQQATAVGALGSARAGAGVAAFTDRRPARHLRRLATDLRLLIVMAGHRLLASASG